MSGVLVSREGGIMRITLDRPEKLNALDGELVHKMRLAFEEAAIVHDVRVVVLTGSGRAFCAGQDLADPAVAPGSDLGMTIEHFYNPLIRTMRALPKPIVARVNGVAAGAGANLAFAADLVVAARSASFIESFSRIGLLPDSGGTWMMPRLFGYARAVGLAMLGERVSAEQAHAWGAIWQVVDDQDLDSACATLAETLAQAGRRRARWARSRWRSNPPRPRRSTPRSTTSVNCSAGSVRRATTARAWRPLPLSASRSSRGDERSSANARRAMRGGHVFARSRLTDGRDGDRCGCAGLRQSFDDAGPRDDRPQHQRRQRSPTSRPDARVNAWSPSAEKRI